MIAPDRPVPRPLRPSSASGPSSQAVMISRGRKLSVFGLFVVFLAMNISKWYIDAGFRISYYIPVMGLWLLLALHSPGLSRWVNRGPITLFITLKLLLVAGLFLHFACVAVMSDLRAPGLYAKGISVELINGGFIVALILFLTRIEFHERQTVLRMYVWAAVVTAGYSLAQAVLAYGFGLDFDAIVATYLPLWDSAPPSMRDDVFGLISRGGRAYFRLTGPTGDPNINGSLLALALPALMYSGISRNKIRVGLAALFVFTIILLTVSNTAIPLAILVLVAFAVYVRRGAGTLPRTVVAMLVVAGVVLVFQQGAVIQEVLRFKLASGGTASSHLEIGREAIRIWLQHPLGIGLNNFSVHSDYLSTHNSYLRILVELGPLALVAMVCWIAYCAFVCFRLKTHLGFSAGCSVIVLALASIGHDIFLRFEFQLPIYLLTTIAVLQKQDLESLRGVRADEQVSI